VTQEYQLRDRWFGFQPALARQSPGFSDLEGRYMDYGELEGGLVVAQRH